MHPNEKVLRDIDEAQIAGDIDAFLAAYTEDVVVHIPGTGSLSGTYKGRDQLAELFGRFMERTPEFTFEPHAYFADDEHGVSLQRSHYKRGSETLDSDDAFICHFRNGKVAEFWIRPEDQAALDTFIG
jgi:hypothetical protein